MIKPEDIIIEVEKIDVSGGGAGPIWRTVVTASFAVSQQLALDNPYLEYNPDAMAHIKDTLRRKVWDRIYSTGVYRNKVHEAIESGRDAELMTSIMLNADGYRQGLISMLSYLDMPALSDEKPRPTSRPAFNDADDMPLC